MLLSKIMMLLINVSRVWRHALSWWSGKGLGIWNLCPAPLFPQLRPFACEVKANADMTPQKLRPRPSRRFATAFTRAQWQRKDHRKGAALAMPPDGRGLSPGTSKSRRCGAQRKAAPVPAQRSATRVQVVVSYSRRLPGGGRRRRNRKKRVGWVVKEKATTKHPAGATEGAQRNNAPHFASPPGVALDSHESCVCQPECSQGPARALQEPHCLRAACCGQSSLALALGV